MCEMSAGTSPFVPVPYRVEKYRRENADTFTMELAPADGSAPPPFAPGQFNMLYVFGVGEVPLSISGNPAKPATVVHTTRAVGTVTRVIERLKKNDIVGLRGPFGSNWPVADAEDKDVVVVAGGIGLAPLRPTLYHVFSNRKRYRNLVLLYGMRTPQDLLYKTELNRWKKKTDIQVHLTADHDSPDWNEDVGVVTSLVPRAPFDPQNAVAMVCGPEVMIRYSVLELEKRGMPHENIYVSLERNMKCAVGFCGRCQFGPEFICKDGPVFPYNRVKHLLELSEV